MNVTKSTRLQIVTSGYTDRYVASNTTYTCEWRGACMRWRDRQEAVSGILALIKAGDTPTDAEIKTAISAIRNADCAAYALYEDGATSGSIRTTYERLVAGIIAVTQYMDRSVTAEHYEQQLAIASTLTDEEWLVIAWGLSECNRRNRTLLAAGLRPGMDVLI